MKGSPKLLIVQNADFREGATRLDAGEPETFHDQHKSIRFVRGLSKDWNLHIASSSAADYWESLGPSIEVSGWRNGVWRDRFGEDLLARFSPDAVLIRLPNPWLISAASSRGVPCLPLLADVFRPFNPLRLVSRTEIRAVRMNWRMRAATDAASVIACGNHSLAASQSLHDVIGVPLNRCVPWEWSKLSVLPDFSPKKPSGRPTVFYVGRLISEKGILDLIQAIHHLAKKSVDVHLLVAGEGPKHATLANLIRTNKLDQSITLLGVLPKHTVREIMGQSDVVVMPSHYSYAEGLPNSVVESLAFGVPIVTTNHPAVAGRLVHRQSAMIVPEKAPLELANAIGEIIADQGLSTRLRRNAVDAYNGMFVGASWYDVVGAFLADPNNSTDWVSEFSLSNLITMPDGGRVVSRRSEPEVWPKRTVTHDLGS